jgi:hypothetical protein
MPMDVEEWRPWLEGNRLICREPTLSIGLPVGLVDFGDTTLRGKICEHPTACVTAWKPHKYHTPKDSLKEPRQ